MATRKTTTARTNTRSSGTRKSTGKKTTSNTKRTSSKKSMQAEEPFLKKEILVLLAFAFSVLLFLSNLGLCGFAGQLLKGLVMGLFGIMGYLVPILLFIGMCFYAANRGNKKAARKLFAACMVIFLFCGLFQIVTQGNHDASRTLLDYYKSSANGNYGGMIGGLFAMMLLPTFGMLGSCIILFVPLLVGMVYITEKSVVDFVGERSSDAYHYAKEEVEYQRERYVAKQEERKRYRAEQRVRGIASAEITKVADEEDDEIKVTQTAKKVALNKEEKAAKKTTGKKLPEEKTMAAVSKEPSSADVFAGEIHLPREYQTAIEEAELDNIIKIASEVDAILAEREDQSEVEPPFSVDDEIEEPPKDKIVRPDFFYHEEFNEPTVSTKSASVMEADIETEQEDEIFTPADTRIVTTASGKVIEVETEFKENYESGRNVGSALERKETKATGVKEAAASQIVMPKKKVVIDYKLPPVDLLTKGKVQVSGDIDIQLKETAIKLQQTLRNFGVGVTVTDISCGPSVTRYELQPEQGVKVSKIVSLADDIKLNLAAADIRIEAPIPGKAAVGIEVPNKENQTVHFRDLLESSDFRKHSSSICFGVGKDIAGQTVVADIARMPHLLIAGATGSGKSVCINTLIMSILYKAKPSEVKLIMIDPKVVELSVYNGIPHLMIPVVTDPKLASSALNWAVAEMTERYKKFADYNVRDLKGYNQKVEAIEDIDDDNKPEVLPQIVIIVDELADLMMVAPGEVEDAICRLAQLARAAGIHLVIATQRPSVNVITGLIKANVPSRIAFSVSSGVDSRTIIDMNGAEKLLGKGDMLFYPSGCPKPMRVQGAFITDKEVMKVVEFWSEQGKDEVQNPELTQKITQSMASAKAGAAGSDRDDYFVQAGRFIIEKEKASIGMLQRAFKIGFNRAARIMDQLADAGVVGEEEGTKPRKVLMSMEEFDQLVEEVL